MIKFIKAHTNTLSSALAYIIFSSVLTWFFNAINFLLSFKLAVIFGLFIYITYLFLLAIYTFLGTSDIFKKLLKYKPDNVCIMNLWLIPTIFLFIIASYFVINPVITTWLICFNMYATLETLVNTITTVLAIIHFRKKDEL